MLNCQDFVWRVGRLPWRGSCCYVTRVRTGIKMVMVMSVPIKNGSPTASLKRGTFMSSFLVIVPRITEGEILDFVKRQTMGPAACTVHGEKVHTNLLDESWWPPSPYLLLHGRALPFFHPFFFSFSLSLSFFPSFLPFGTWLFLALTQLSGGFRDHVLQRSMLDSSCQARCKFLSRSCRLQTSADSPWVFPASHLWTEPERCLRTWTFILYM